MQFLGHQAAISWILTGTIKAAQSFNCCIRRNILLWFAIHQWCSLSQPMQFSRKLESVKSQHWSDSFFITESNSVLSMIQSTTVIMSFSMGHTLFGKMVLQNICNIHCADNIHQIQCITASPAAWGRNRTSETKKWVAGVRFLIAKDDKKQKDVNHMV